MLSAIAFLVAVKWQNPAVDPDLLPIGPRGVVTVRPGQIVETRSGRVVTVRDIVRSVEDDSFVYLGEEHATKAHQDLEASMIEELASDGRSVTVGMEMFTRPKQDVLDLWSADKLSQNDFLTQVDWKEQWGFPYEFYRPVLEVVRIRNLNLVALNIPRDWVRTAAHDGLPALPTSAKLQLPPRIDLDNKVHRRVFDAIVGPHSMPGVNPDNMYAAQVLWDAAMADTVLKYISIEPKKPSPLFVVVAGAGHLMYGQGINYRIAKRHGGKGVTVVMLESDQPVQVSRGIADFVFLSKPQSASN